MTTRRYGSPDDQWERIKDWLHGREGHVGRTARNNRLFVEEVLYRYRAGMPWPDLSENFGDFRVIYTRYSRCSKRVVCKRLFEAFATGADNQYATIDPTIVRAHQHSARGQKSGASRSDRTQRRRAKYGNLCHRGCAGQSNRLRTDARTGR